MTITDEDYKLLRRPFTAEAVKFRIDGRPKDGKVRILTYIDSRLAAERLSEVDPNWSGYPTVLGGHSMSLTDALANGLPIVYELTVKGVTRADVGQIGKAVYGDDKGTYAADDKHAKMAVSDAIKRSAVLFGVGSYLYTLGNVYVDEKKHTTGGGKYLNAAGKSYLKEQYARFISTKAFKERFGEPISYGEELANQDSSSESEPEPVPKQTETGEDSGVQQQEVAPAKSSEAPESDSKTTEGADPHVEVIAALFELVGRSPQAGREWATERKNKNLAVKKTVRQVLEKDADNRKAVSDLLKNYGLDTDKLLAKA